MRYLTLKEFNKRVEAILKIEAMIGSTVQDEIRWKVNEIMKLTRIPVDISYKQKDNPTSDYDYWDDYKNWLEQLKAGDKHKDLSLKTQTFTEDDFLKEVSQKEKIADIIDKWGSSRIMTRTARMLIAEKIIQYLEEEG